MFYKFFKLFEDEWFLLEIQNDEKLAEKKKTAGNKNFQGFKKKKVKKMSRVQTSISKSSDEIQFLNDAMQVQILNNPENEILLRNVYARRLEELHKAAVC